MFQRNQAGDGRRGVQIGHKRNRRTSKMQRGGNACALGIIGDLLGLQHAAAGQQIGMHDIERMLVDKGRKPSNK